MKRILGFPLIAAASVAATLAFSGPASATIWDIDAVLGPGQDGMFGFSSIHRANQFSNPRMGKALAHHSGAATGFYDDSTGMFQAEYGVFDALGWNGSTVGGVVGVVSLWGSLGSAADWNQSGDALGFLMYTITLTGGSLYDFLGGTAPVEVFNNDFFLFNDVQETPVPSGYYPNSFLPSPMPVGADRIMTLWGGTSSNGATDSNGAYTFDGSLLGTDLRFLMSDSGGGTSITEPVSLALFGAGLVGLGLFRRRRGAA